MIKIILSHLGFFLEGVGEETINFLKERTLSAEGETKICGPGGQHSAMDSILASNPLVRGSIIVILSNFSLDIDEIY